MGLRNLKLFLNRIAGALVIALISIVFINIVQLNLYSESKRTIVEINNQIENKIALEIKYSVEKLDYMNRYINDEINKYKDVYNEDNFLKSINEISKGDLFEYIGVVDKKGYLNIGDGNKKIYVGDRRYFQHSIKGETHVSEKIKGRIKEEDQIVYSRPLIINNKIEGVLVGIEPKVKLQGNLNETIFLNKAKVYIISEDGDIILEPEEKNNVFEFNKDEVINQIKKQSEEGIQVIGIDEEENIFSYKYIENSENWYVLSVADLDEVFTGTHNTIEYFTVIIILAVIFYVIVGGYKDMKNEERIEYATKIDSLTKLSNLEKFKADCKRKIQRNIINKTYAILAFDIKNFKAINELFGYQKGDSVLKIIGENIRSIDFVSVSTRASEENFMVLIEIEDDNDLDEKITYISRHVVKNLSSRNKFDLELSIGAFKFNSSDELEIEKFVDNANLSRLESKKFNNIPYYLYNDDLKFRVEQKLIVERDLKQSLKNREFKILYQPKVDINTEKIVSVEALIRWNHKDYGFISPDVFIQIAEKNGHINFIGRWIIKEVCKELKKCRENDEIMVPVAINISRVELYQATLINYIENMIKKYEIDPDLLEFEITETAALNDIDYINKRIYELKSLGVKVSMDDFGTGSSSLTSLKGLNIDTLKIDKTISDDLETNEKTKMLLKSIIKLAKDYNFNVVCEGIETKKQVEILRQLKCDMIQGYVYHKPLELDEVKKILNKQNDASYGVVS